VLALPGGSGGPAVSTAARAEGFRLVLGSVPRRYRPGGNGDVPRFAVRRDDGLMGFRALVEHEPAALLRAWLRYRALVALRSTVGDDLYARVRKVWLGSRRAAA